MTLAQILPMLENAFHDDGDAILVVSDGGFSSTKLVRRFGAKRKERILVGEGRSFEVQLRR